MVSACCWESTSLRITLAIDSFVYFANVRYDYPWCYFADTIVYAYRNHEESVTDITFWNIKKNEVFVFRFYLHVLRNIFFYTNVLFFFFLF